jgi:hypothetical protein
VDQTKDFGKLSKDPAEEFVNCYKSLIEDINLAENQLRIEYSNYI